MLTSQELKKKLRKAAPVGPFGQPRNQAYMSSPTEMNRFRRPTMAFMNELQIQWEMLQELQRMNDKLDKLIELTLTRRR